jgi:hypothetical protein
MADIEKEKYNYEEMSKLNFKDKVSKKMGFNYISWADAWDQLKILHPTASRKVYETDAGRPYFDDGKTCWVKVSVTICGDEEIEYYPILNHKNQSIAVGEVTSLDVSNAIQRGMTKAIARHGLGLYVYRGEDLPTVDLDTDAALKSSTDAIKSFGQKQLSDKEFAELQGRVISELTILFNRKECSSLVSDYCSNQIGKKLSATTKDDVLKLVGADIYFKSLAAQLGISLDA